MNRHQRVKACTLLASASLFTLSHAAFAQDEGADEPIPTDRIVILGANIPDERRDTSEISSVIDSADFAATGAGDAADALLRITGITLNDGRFVIVRGLNERYSSATINGSPLPSPEPLRRVSPLDLFPTNTLESLLVQKTFSPQYSGEFGGGLVELRTRALPEGGFFEVSGSLGADLETHFTDGSFLIDGGDLDFTGFDDGARNFPIALPADVDADDLSDDERVQIGQAFNNPSLLIFQSGDVSPNVGASTSFGNRFDFGPDISIGVITALSYDSDWQTRDGIRNSRFRADQGPNDFFNGRRFSTQNTVRTSALVSVGADLYENHEVKLVLLGARSTDGEQRRILEFGPLDGEVRATDSVEYFERQSWFTQATGSSFLPGLFDATVSWRVSYAEAFRDAPFQSELTRQVGAIGGNGFSVFTDASDVFALDIVQPDATFNFEGDPDDYTVGFSKINDSVFDGGLDAEVPLTFVPLVDDFVLRAGYAYRDNQRQNAERTFAIDDDLGVGADRTLRPDVLFSDAAIASGDVSFTDTTGGQVPEQFEGEMEVEAAYIGFDTQVNDRLRIATGVRYEDSLQTSNAFSLLNDFDDDGTEFPDSSGVFFGAGDGIDDDVQSLDAQISSEYYLPAFTATYNFYTDMQLRLAYSETITRPQFRELAPQDFDNELTDIVSSGNPFLENTETRNYDARLEYYFARDQFVTLGLFYKELENPIEEYNLAQGDRVQTSFLNVPEAEVMGFEFEFERQTDFPGFFPERFFSSKELITNFNYTYTDSSITVPDDVRVPTAGFVSNELQPILVFASELAEDGRRLVGQSQHIANLQLGYEDFENDSSARILVNYASDRFRDGGNPGNNLAPIEEQLPISVDFLYKKGFVVSNYDFELGFTARNIFGDDYEAFRQLDDGTDFNVDTYRLSPSFSLSFKAEL